MEKTDKKKNLIQIIKFGTIGIMNTAIDYLLFALFFSVCNFDKSIAQVFATAIAMTNSYILNRYFTFGQKGFSTFSPVTASYSAIASFADFTVWSWSLRIQSCVSPFSTVP